MTDKDFDAAAALKRRTIDAWSKKAISFKDSNVVMCLVTNEPASDIQAAKDALQGGTATDDLTGMESRLVPGLAVQPAVETFARSTLGKAVLEMRYITYPVGDKSAMLSSISTGRPGGPQQVQDVKTLSQAELIAIAHKMFAAQPK